MQTTPTDVLTIWPGTGIPPGAEASTWSEQATQPPGSPHPDGMIRNVVIPTLTMFKPETANGTAIIVAPGGAFHYLMMYHEGYDAARWLTQLGVTAFVLKYRVQHTPEDDAEMRAYLESMKAGRTDQSRMETPPAGHPRGNQARLWGEEDGRQAIRYLRQHAAELGIAPDRIGIIGFSAGGGVSVNATLEYDELSRPDFAAGIYPAYRIVTPIPDDAPPLFLAIAGDDATVAPISSARLYETWRKAGKPAELHIFANGGHGFGMRQQNQASDQWTGLFEHWLATQGYA